MIDSGSVLSIMKKSIINEDILWTEDDEKVINGLGGEPIRTKGKIEVEIEIDDENLTHEFHVIGDEDVALRYSGILGSDFLKTGEVTTRSSKL